jgi:hypothetical protein
MGLAYTGWELPDWERRRLAERFPPIYAVDPDLQHHVTFAYGVNDDSPLPVTTSGLVVGHADDLKGVQALVMEIACSVTRPDGSIYHITWSLDRAAGRKPVCLARRVAKGGANSDRINSALRRLVCETDDCRRTAVGPASLIAPYR